MPRENSRTRPSGDAFQAGALQPLHGGLAGIGQAVEPAEEGQVLERGQLVVDRNAVADEAHAAARFGVARIVAEDADLAAAGFGKAAMMRSRVVLPAPLRPIKARQAPGRLRAGRRAARGSRRRTSRRPQPRPRSLLSLAGTALARDRAARSRGPECQREPRIRGLARSARHDLTSILRAGLLAVCRGIGGRRPRMLRRAGQLDAIRVAENPKMCACVFGSCPRSCSLRRRWSRRWGRSGRCSRPW
jgi:hypothetical protein